MDTGDPKNPATWKLPIEAYLPTKADTQFIVATRDELIDECMKAAGYDQWTPAPDLPELGGKTLTDWRYGIHNAGLAAKRGYHPDEAEQRAYDEAQEAGAVDDSGADDTTLKGCVAQADEKAPTAQPPTLAQQISDDSYVESMNAPSVVDAFAKWSSCMKAQGYSYTKPMDANDDPRFSDPYEVKDEEIATAKADVACRDKYDVEKVWFDAETALQQAAIAKNQAALEEARMDIKSAVAKAKSVSAVQ
ncbi:hypothetical protein B7755_048585 [Streptomyces sp. NBS 14/10]|uniref:hypothetical protein n=1 Tax=Streptomyces sp. NBS 14/10 TaxID=1945643 RepID=UPI000B7DF392|nr:hypothetical protein [Streptomyces sp. NBS 14/10]KAK1185260.1 hypothetical protein B7755_048585 [Streptomyces sp. NBS 14/10]